MRGVGEATWDVLVSLGNNPSLCSPPPHTTPHSQETVGKEACTLQHTATHYNTLQHTRRPEIVRRQLKKRVTSKGLFVAATHCNTLQHTATDSQETDVKEGYKKRSLYRMTQRSLNILRRNTL